MSFLKNQSKWKATKPEVPYKASIVSKSVVEDVEKATRVFGGDKYGMILMAANRSYELAHGAESYIDVKPGQHKPIVTALLEMEQGHIGPDYMFKQFDAVKRKK